MDGFPISGALVGAVSEVCIGSEHIFRASTSTDMISIKFFLLSCEASSTLRDMKCCSQTTDPKVLV